MVLEVADWIHLLPPTPSDTDAFLNILADSSPWNLLAGQQADLFEMLDLVLILESLPPLLQLRSDTLLLHLKLEEVEVHDLLHLSSQMLTRAILHQVPHQYLLALLLVVESVIGCVLLESVLILF